MFYARQGGPAAVAPYAADPQNLYQWQEGQRRHREKLASVPRLSDQSVPETLVDASLHRGRERSRVFQEIERHREVGKENRKLMGALKNITKKQCITLKRIETDPWLPRVPVSSNKDFYRKLKQKALDAENEANLKRLMNVRTTFDRKADERQFRRHKQAVQDMRKVPPPHSVLQRERKRIHLPQLQDLSGEASFIKFGSGEVDAAGTGATSMRSGVSRSMPNLHAKSAQRQSPAIQDGPRAPQRQAVAFVESSAPSKGHTESDAMVSKPAQQQAAGSFEKNPKPTAAGESLKPTKRHAKAGVPLTKPAHQQVSAAADVLSKARQQLSASAESSAKTPHRQTKARKQRQGQASKDVPAFETPQQIGSESPARKTGEAGFVITIQEVSEADRMAFSQSSWKSAASAASFASSMHGSAREVLSPGGGSGASGTMSPYSHGAMSPVAFESANAELAAEVVGSVSSNWYASRTDASAWTVRSSRDDFFLDSGYEGLGLNEQEIIDTSAVSPAEVMPSWFPDDAEQQGPTDNKANAHEELE